MVNKVILIGNVGKAPTIANMPNGGEIATFNLATSESWKDKVSGEKKTITEWHKIVVYSTGLVNLTKSYITKGSKIYIEGKLKTRSYTDKKGVDKYITEVLLQGFDAKILLLGSSQTSSKTQPQTGSPQKDLWQQVEEICDGSEVEGFGDDIPF